MEDHHHSKHDNNNKKKNSKSVPMAIQIGGSFGMGGGVMLFGGALVVATVVSIIAVSKTKQKHRPSISKDTHTDTDANPNDMVTTDDQNISDVDSWPLNLHNPSDDEVTSNMETEAKDLQTLTLDEDDNFGSYNDEQVESGEDIMFSAVGEDQQNTSIYVDYAVFGTSQVEKITLGCEEQVVMSAPTELRFPSSDDEDSCSKISDEGIELAVEVEDNVEYEKATDITTIEDNVAEKEETVFMNATTEVACANEVKVKEEKQTGDWEGELSNKTCPENIILSKDDHQQTQCNKKQLVIGCAEMGSIEEEIRVNDNKETAVEVVREEESPRQLTNKQEMIVDDEIPLIQPIQEEEDEFKLCGSKSEVRRWSIILVVLIWCVCHWYFKLPYYLECSLVGGSLFFIILATEIYRTTYLVQQIPL